MGSRNATRPTNKAWPALRFQVPDEVLLKDLHRLRRVLRPVHPLRRVPPNVSEESVASRMLAEVRCHVVHLTAGKACSENEEQNREAKREAKNAARNREARR